MIKRPSRLRAGHGDRTAMLIAGLCFVHCVAGPMLLSLAGLASLIHISERVEPLFLLSSIVMGSATLIPGYRRKHRRRSCLAMFLAGLFCLLMRRRIESTAISLEPIAAAIGAILIIAAHLLNHRFSQQCQCCEPPTEASRVD